MPQTMIDLTSASEHGRLSEVPDGKDAKAPLEAWVSAPAEKFASTMDAPKQTYLQTFFLWLTKRTTSLYDIS